MKPLPSTDWPGITSIDGAVAALCEHLALLHDDALQGVLQSEQDYAQLRANVEWLKSGFECIEKLLIKDANKTKITPKPRRGVVKKSKSKSH